MALIILSFWVLRLMFEFIMDYLTYCCAKPKHHITLEEEMKDNDYN